MITKQIKLNMRLSPVIIFFFVVNVSAQLRNQPTDSSKTWQILKYDTNASWRSIKHSVTRPLHWKGKDYAKLGSIVAGTAIIAVADNETSTFFRGHDSSFPQPIQDFGYYFAKPKYYLMMNAGIYGFGLFTKNEQVRKTAVLIISSSLTAGYLQILARSAFGRARPYSGQDPYTFKLFASEEEYFSFPSGHTVLGMTIAHSVAKQFKSTWAKIGIYSIGSAPAISRLIDGAHWASDIVFGAALSIVVVDGIDKFLFNSKTYNYPQKDKQITWNLKFNGRQLGIVGTF
ncbi:phosphatase PAP2 family protein [Cellulophaga sp. F20128]|uniref:phosphatase PAP2 family protein n=1 Tax=Cellulophaga sp. F20128 TaxID=2926413 RepID=UPI001FF47A12|nr:phosphatase PAP2 family protein [Cellulophaga sp. F20128]MCK0156282.1 phosphatase PAP2 family protein [Cellulophaga sp. F20128]